MLVCISGYSYAQEQVPTDTLKTDSVQRAMLLAKRNAAELNSQYDVGDAFKDIFHPGRRQDSVRKKSSGITVVPNISANPTIGFQLGIKAVAGRVLGNIPGTYLSVAATSASITTKGIIYFYLNHNVFTPGNTYNFQGNLVASKSVTPDFGLGIGNVADNGNALDKALTNPGRKGYAYNSYYFNIREKVYKEVEKGLFVGAGLSFDMRSEIEQKGTENPLSPYNVYNARYGFDNDHYAANGFLFNVQYNTRDNPNRAYKGIYTDIGIRTNQTFIGSSKNDLQFTVDFRKYWSLSSTHPEHVIAFWTWGSYLLSGSVPYLELPGTGKDGSFRSGRGYTAGYFKGTKYHDMELEYRFPILNNKFLSGVAFGSLQTANDGINTRIFEKWQPGGGGGLRVLFNKATRTNLCLDYAWGRYGNRGFFLGLNDAF
ncbi:BamA/TamA family outer membrane protein [Mucilaginibacter sp. KACC 22063]|uniref:BamA/TamA family outer membrane protein n=1 Tax=Mucilaginibacter sp. KACC 22063 TaxID=3025666 RepID=UPI0023672CF3|nr:BamA/TamA family outer membrane protein [Mucilaginibacter sp. KACC 22063]WDF56070.1 BamA/TamA family outer membrane protein [Mucilaginibacter sp. KACC 22063]